MSLERLRALRKDQGGEALRLSPSEVEELFNYIHRLEFFRQSIWNQNVH